MLFIITITSQIFLVIISSVKWELLTRNEVGLFQIFDTLKLLKTTKIAISEKTPLFKITKK